VFQLEAVQANDGDCLLLHYDAGPEAGLILIDGGSSGVYRKFLGPRLRQVRGSNSVLNLRLVIVSHIDADHITGILDFFKELSELQNDGKPLPFEVESLWHNSFGGLVGTRAAAQSAIVSAALGGDTTSLPDLQEKVRAVVASVQQGNDLRLAAARLTMINAEADADLILAPRSGKCQYRIAPDLTFSILGPHQAELDKLEDAWKKAKARCKARPKTYEQSVAADYLNRTVPNLSSIVILVTKKERNGKTRRMLLTGDAGGDLILKALKRQKLLDAKGKIHVDLLKIQHHGSKHSTDAQFFRSVTADRYVISGNGKHGIPHRETLTWLSQSRHNEACDIYMTNRTGFEGLTKMLQQFLAEERRNEPKHTFHFRKKDDHSIHVTIS
jgi:beta-lactamase superfamily II metal-dependent hydrolase